MSMPTYVGCIYSEREGVLYRWCDQQMKIVRFALRLRRSFAANSLSPSRTRAKIHLELGHICSEFAHATVFQVVTKGFRVHLSEGVHVHLYKGRRRTEQISASDLGLVGCLDGSPGEISAKIYGPRQFPRWMQSRDKSRHLFRGPQISMQVLHSLPIWLWTTACD